MRNKGKALLLVVMAWLLLPATFLRGQAQQPSNESARAVAADTSNIIYVAGAVRSPARFILRRNVHLTEVLGCVGGLLPESNNKVRIFRVDPSTIEMTVIDVELKAIKNHRAEDLILKPYDVVEIVSKKRSYSGHCITADCTSAAMAPLFKLPFRIIK
jgi:hypothetical protein